MKKKKILFAIIIFSMIVTLTKVELNVRVKLRNINSESFIKKDEELCDESYKVKTIQLLDSDEDKIIDYTDSEDIKIININLGKNDKLKKIYYKSKTSIEKNLQGNYKEKRI